MTVTICTGKLHRVTVTGADLSYEGSITLDPVLMEAAGILPFQLVHINSLANAAHWETYAILGEPNSGTICLNGCPARLFQPGDLVIIMAMEQLTKAEAAVVEHRVVHVDSANRIVKTTTKRPAQRLAAE
jgi:aspartate 1-decarboxylase